MIPLRLLRDEDTVRVQYLHTDAEFLLSVNQPVSVLHAVTTQDDATMVEVLSPMMLVVRQVDEAGESHTLTLTPTMAIELARMLDSYVLVPASCPARLAAEAA